MIKIPENVSYIINELNNYGFEAYIVGGCTRDILLGKTPSDWDITTSATPFEVKNIFKKTYDTGIEHGTVTTIINNCHYEITTYRIDGEYEDNRRPTEVFYTKELNEDLRRRDFTMNAIAYHPKDGFIDPFNGQEDIKNRLIRGVGNPQQRFCEDALRIMRGIRFSAQIDFDIEEETHKALISTVHLIENISIERIRDEFHKLILSDNPDKLNSLHKYEVFNYVNKDLFDYFNKYLEKIILCLNNSTKDLLIRLPLMYQFMNTKDIKNTLTFLRVDNKTINYVAKQVNILYNSNMDFMPNNCGNEYEIRKLISIIGVDDFYSTVNILDVMSKTLYSETSDNVDKIKRIFNETVSNSHCISIKDLAINGTDLMSSNIKSGKILGDILNFLLDEVLKNPDLNNKDLLLNLAIDFYNKYDKTELKND